ncbi:MAG: MlaD family protein [Candidatus Omnitrophota bacterium]
MPISILDIRRYLVEIKLGVFFIAAIILFFVAIISIREVSFFKGTYLLKVKFSFVEGLKSASPVRFCGVDVGEIKELAIKEEKQTPTVVVLVKIQQGVNIPTGSRFFINSLSLFGEKYLEIIPPGGNINSYIKEGAVIQGIDSLPLFDVVKGTHETMQKLEDFILKSDIKESFTNISSLATEIRDAIVAMRGKDGTITNINALAKEVRGLVVDLKDQDGTIANINELAKEIRGLILDIKDRKGTVGRLLYDDTLYKKTDEFLEDVSKNPWKLLYKPKQRK